MRSSDPEHPMAQSSFTSSRSVNFWRRFLIIAGFWSHAVKLGFSCRSGNQSGSVAAPAFTTNITYVNGSHPNLQVGDVAHFEIAVSQDQIVISSTVFMDTLLTARPIAMSFNTPFRATGRLSTVVTEKKFIPKMAHSPHLLLARQ